MAYKLRFERPKTHLLAITMHATGLRGVAAEFALPALAPGRYRITDYAKIMRARNTLKVAGG